MSLPAFIEALAAATREHRLQWRLVNGALRTTVSGDYCCPITALAGGCDAAEAEAVGHHVLGMPQALVWRVIYAADEVEGCDPALRRRLLAACGVGEGS